MSNDISLIPKYGEKEFHPIAILSSLTFDYMRSLPSYGGIINTFKYKTSYWNFDKFIEKKKNKLGKLISFTFKSYKKILQLIFIVMELNLLQ